MIDAGRILEEQVRVLGVFTDYKAERGWAFGEDASKVIDLLQHR